MEIFLTFSPSQKVRMKNSTHFNYMQMFVRNFKAYTTENADYNGYLKTLEDTLAQEDKLYAITRGSEHTVSLNDAEEARDTVYKSVSRTIVSFAGLPQLSQYDAACKLKRVIDKYGYDPRAKSRQRMGAMSSMLTELQDETNAPLLETLGITTDVALLNEQNELVINSLNTRNKEQSLLKHGALQNARKATDAAYEEFALFAQSMCCYLKDAKLEALICQTNVEIKNLIYFELTNHKADKEDVPADQQGGTGQPQPDAQQGGTQQVPSQGQGGAQQQLPGGQQDQNPPQVNQPGSQQQGGLSQDGQQQGGQSQGGQQQGTGTGQNQGATGGTSNNGDSSAGSGSLNNGGTPSGGNGTTGGAPQGGTDGSQSSGTGTGDSGNGPIYTPVKPAVM